MEPGQSNYMRQLNRGLEHGTMPTPGGRDHVARELASPWAGNCIADVLGLDRMAAKGQVQELIRKWKSEWLLADKTELDAKQMPRLYVVTVKRATDLVAEKFNDMDAEEDEEADYAHSLI